MTGIVNLSSYTYHLPEEHVAKFPLPERATSKLLYYGNSGIQHYNFRSIIDLLPANTALFFNNTRVIPARIPFTKETGALIEIFLLQPLEPSPVMSQAMDATGTVVWKCMIGNAKRWKTGSLLRSLQIAGQEVTVQARRRNEAEVELSWNHDIPFAALVEAMGKTPLPPYLHREPTEADKSTYQTVYSQKDGAVAAPTAGLHFTDEVLAELSNKGIKTNFLTLHVSAGTFQPIKVEDVTKHNMHSEQMVVTRENIQQLLEKDRFCVAVGTTSLRTLESIFWYGVQLLENPEASFLIPKLFPYEQKGTLPGNEEVLRAVLKRMDDLKVNELTGKTEIFIFPGYKFRLVRGLVTNFHQPQSTLILLVAAFVGADWRNIYEEAIRQNYRFLSYGDSSLLIPPD